MGGDDPIQTPGVGLTNIFLRQLEEGARSVSGLDRFQIQPGARGVAAIEAIEAGNFRFLIGKRLTPRLYVGVQADPTLDLSQQPYEVIYRLNRNMSVVGSVDPEGKREINYRLRLRY